MIDNQQKFEKNNKSRILHFVLLLKLLSATTNFIAVVLIIQKAWKPKCEDNVIKSPAKESLAITEASMLLTEI